MASRFAADDVPDLCEGVRVLVTTTDGALVCDLGADSAEWSFTRVANDISVASVATGDRCPTCVEDVQPWCSELRFYSLATGVLLWAGPVITVGRTTGEIIASDRAVRLQRRVWSAAKTLTGTVNNYVNLALVEADKLGDTGLNPTTIFNTSTVSVSRANPKGSNVYATVQAIAGSAIWWAVVGDTFAYGDQTNLISGAAYSNNSFVDVPEVSSVGDIQANQVFVRYNGGAAVTSYPRTLHESDVGCEGVLQVLLNFDEVTSAADALTLAEGHYLQLSGPRVVVNATAGLGLYVPDVVSGRLVPGVLNRLHFDELDTLAAGGGYVDLQLSSAVVSGTGRTVDTVEAVWSQPTEIFDRLA